MPTQRNPSISVASVPRLALRSAEAAAALSVSEDWFAQHVAIEVPRVVRGRLKLYAVADLSAWLQRNGERLLDGATR